MLREGSTGPSVTTLQNQLRAQGFDPGPSDGRFGPRTAAAVRAFQTAHHLTVDGIVGPQTVSALGPVGGAPAPAQSGGDALVAQKYPQFAWALSIPEVGNLLRQATAEGWTPDKFQAALYATAWWRQTQSTTREWENLIAVDPATATQKAAASTAHVRAMAAELGVTLDPWSAQDIGDHVLRYGLTDDQLRQRIMDNYQFDPNNPAGEMGSVSQQIQSLAAQYLVPQSDYNLGGWTGAILRGAATVPGYEAQLKTLAKGLFPAMGSQIDAGFTPSQIVDPYRQMASQTLEIAPTTVNFTDPKWQRAIDTVDPKSGQHQMMPLYQWQTTMRQDPVYGYDKTTGARTQASTLATKLAQTFGALG